MNARGSSAVVGAGAILSMALFMAVAQVAAQAQTPDNPIARLDARLASGEAHLEYDPVFGYLPDLLEQLDVRVDSQVLVFSKTSFQHALITPQNPRAIYFNDNVSVGSVPGGTVFEIMALDPTAGIAFYSLSTERLDEPRFERRGVECMFCHGPGNFGAPAMVVTSVIPRADGTPAYTSTFFSNIDHRTPFGERWGGWYVTGTHGSLHHQGNAVASDPDRPLELEEAGTQNRVALDDRFDTTKHMAGTSDLVALMTLEHQSGMANLINSVTVRYRAAERAGYIGEAEWADLDAAIDDLVGYMLFVDEAPLEAPVAGVSTFAETFPQRGPRDRKGRSLRDFDLQTRLFRYPLSYMIYQENFDRIPARVLERVYRRLYDVLAGRETGGRYAALAAEDRAAVLEILRDTKPGLPAYYY